ncbi:hypothetical protein, partial [Streptomyces sp. NRRL B-24085]|uniref:hypothetical protein n=1 Tax=Streptomyces sp. NRRL B-24085 TaxID=1709476 RepID=UPI000A93A7DE
GSMGGVTGSDGVRALAKDDPAPYFPMDRSCTSVGHRLSPTWALLSSSLDMTFYHSTYLR